MSEHIEFSRELKRHKIMRLWNEGVSVEEIAHLTGSTEDSVNSTISALRRAGLPLARRKGRPAVSLDISLDLIKIAEVEARARGLNVRQLLSRIMLAVLTDRMVSAVLDDAEAA